MNKHTTASCRLAHTDQSDTETLVRMAVNEYLPVLRDFDAMGGLSLLTIQSGYSLTLQIIQINLGHIESRLFDLEALEIDPTTFRRSVIEEVADAVTRYRGEFPYNAVPTMCQAVRN